MTALDPRPAIFVLSGETLSLARRLAAAINGEVWGPAQLGGEAERTYASIGQSLREVFRERRPIVGVCASGILIRALAAELAHKQDEAPVIAVARDASAIVPLLGGHHGGNELARRLGEALGLRPAITTAGDIAFAAALDAPPSQWRLRNPDDAKRAMAALLSGQSANIVIEDGPPPQWLERIPHSAQGAISIVVSTRADAKADLVYAPAIIALGAGCERMAEAQPLISLAIAALAEANIAPEAIACVVSIDLKAAEPAIHALAQSLGVPARFFAAATLEQERDRLANPSDLVFKETGCHGVAEGAALAAVGASGRLALPKRVGERATVALARATLPIDSASIGRDRGRLVIAGIGPGTPRARTREVEEAIGEASELVGYRLYLDLLGDLVAGKKCHGMDLGEETARARLALDLAAQGKSVALVSSGDAGIYAMASLVFELIEREGRANWSRLDIRCLAGVSAMQTAAARLGAPLGHDFCAISLSDLLTPWQAIERRIEAAAAADFVIAFYNPVSARRKMQLARAKDMLLRHRPPSTPVVLARNLGRLGESTRVLRLADLGADEVDMLTIVIVGSRSTRVIDRPDGGVWVYTPRGYERKTGAKAGAAQ